MADVLDSNVITEEVDTGAIGSVKVAEPLIETLESPEISLVGDELEIASKSVASAPVLSVVDSGDIVSLDNLRAVSAMFDTGCQSLSDIVSGTGLPQSTVLACIKWLQNNGLAPMIAQSGKFYCSIKNASALAEQLKQCVNCFTSKGGV